MTDTPEIALRRAVGALDATQRARLADTVRAAAESRRGPVAEVWNAFSDLVDEVGRLQRARAAAMAHEAPMRHATRGRR